MRISSHLQLTVLIFFIGLNTNSNAQSNLNDGLVAYYPFNGSANDESVYTNNGVVHGATHTIDRFWKRKLSILF